MGGWVGWVEIFWVCSCHFSLGASIQCPWHLSVTKKVSARRQNTWTRTVVQGICIHHSFRCGFH